MAWAKISDSFWQRDDGAEVRFDLGGIRELAPSTARGSAKTVRPWTAKGPGDNWYLIGPAIGDGPGYALRFKSAVDAMKAVDERFPFKGRK